MEIAEKPLNRCNFIGNLCARIQEIHSEILEHESSVPKCEICTDNNNEFSSIKNQLFLILKINFHIKSESRESISKDEGLDDNLNNKECELIKQETENLTEDSSEYCTNFVAVEDYLGTSNKSVALYSETPKEIDTAHEKLLEKIYKCALCQIKVSKKCYLVLHMKKHIRKRDDQGLRQQPKKTKDGQGTSKLGESSRRKCPFCNRIYKSRHECNVFQPKVVNNFSCAYCPESFSTYPKIYFHHKAQHPDHPKPLSPFQCEVCGKFTVQLSALRHHMKTHTGYTPYACDVCPKRFRTRHQLTEHLRKHIPKAERDDKYKCDICQKKFTFRQSLKKHERLQHSETRKFFPCTICGWKFISETSLKKHQSTHDGDAVPAYKCDDCDRIFEKIKYLNQHRKIQHNVFTDLMLNRKSKKRE